MFSAFREALDETIQEARERGEYTADRARDAMKDAMDRGRDATSEARDRFDFVTQGDFDALKARVATLEERVRGMAAKPAKEKKPKSKDA